jgi:hypothetical protein
VSPIFFASLLRFHAQALPLTSAAEKRIPAAVRPIAPVSAANAATVCGGHGTRRAATGTGPSNGAPMQAHGTIMRVPTGTRSVPIPKTALFSCASPALCAAIGATWDGSSPPTLTDLSIPRKWPVAAGAAYRAEPGRPVLPKAIFTIPPEPPLKSTTPNSCLKPSLTGPTSTREKPSLDPSQHG